jgi:hypothetical protein
MPVDAWARRLGTWRPLRSSSEKSSVDVFSSSAAVSMVGHFNSRSYSSS